jgi:hypothetical protein
MEIGICQLGLLAQVAQELPQFVPVLLRARRQLLT